MVTRRTFLRSGALAGVAAAAIPSCGKRSAETTDGSFDVAIYGATPAGIAAALAAASLGCRVVLLEPTARIGGLTASGLSHTDFRTFESLTGIYLRFTQRVEQHYAKTYGANSAQVETCKQGTHAEPKVNLLVFEEMLAEWTGGGAQTGAPGQIELRRDHVLESVDSDSASDSRRITGLRLRNGDGAALQIRATVCIDASYEGDLMAAATVPYRVGREGRGEFGESLAPEQPDGQLQGYNFRLIATRDPALRVTPAQPSGYRREDYLALLPLLRDGRIRKVFDFPGNCVYKAQIPPLPNNKFDINDVSNGLVRLSLPGDNLGWPDGDAATRARIFAQHLRWNVGLLWFLQNEDAVPGPFRSEAREWGWCNDEFVDTGHLPPQLYVREARRMQGLRIYTQRDSAHAPGDARAVHFPDSVAMGDYGNNCHGTAHEGPLIGGRHTGEFYNPVPPYQIPYATLLPKDVTNLLVPVAASSSHVGFCALRLEPIWTSLGEAAGLAAAIAARGSGTSANATAGQSAGPIPVQQVPVGVLQRQLWRRGAATVYVSDVLPGHPDFEAVQWWATAGGLHGLAPTPSVAQLRGKQIIGQYFEAFPHHAAGLDQALDAALRQRWSALARSLGVAVTALDTARSRGDFIRAGWAALSSP